MPFSSYVSQRSRKTIIRTNLSNFPLSELQDKPPIPARDWLDTIHHSILLITFGKKNEEPEILNIEIQHSPRLPVTITQSSTSTSNQDEEHSLCSTHSRLAQTLSQKGSDRASSDLYPNATITLESRVPGPVRIALYQDNRNVPFNLLTHTIGSELPIQDLDHTNLSPKPLIPSSLLSPSFGPRQGVLLSGTISRRRSLPVPSLSHVPVSHAKHRLSTDEDLACTEDKAGAARYGVVLGEDVIVDVTGDNERSAMSEAAWYSVEGEGADERLGGYVGGFPDAAWGSEGRGGNIESTGSNWGMRAI